MTAIAMSVPEMDEYTYRAYTDDTLDTIKGIRIISEGGLAHLTRTHSGYTLTCGLMTICGDDYEVSGRRLIMKRSGHPIGHMDVSGCTAEVDVEEAGL